MVACAIFFVLASAFCGFVYRAKNQHDLNMQLLGAVRSGDPVETRLLLASGANLNIRDVPQKRLNVWQQMRLAFRLDHEEQEPAISQMSTVLEMALYQESCSQPGGDSENVALVKALLHAGASPNDITHDHEAPLLWAVSHGRLQAIQELLNHGANARIVDEDGRTTLHRMQSRHNPLRNNVIKIAHILAKAGGDVNRTDNDGKTPLMLAMQGEDNAALTDFLIAKGANVNTRSKQGDSALLLGTGIADAETIRTLLKHGAEVNVADKDKNSPLHYAAFRGSIPIVEMILALGAKIDPINVDGDTPLIMCVKDFDHPQLVELLVKYGTDVNHRNNSGETPLSLSRKSNFLRSIRLLKEAGARS